MTFPHTIRTARRALRLTQADLAAQIGVDKQSVSNWECGRSSPWPKEQARVLLQLLELQHAAQGLPAEQERIVDRILKGMNDA